MQRAAQILTGLLALFLVYLSIRYIFTPDALVSFNMLTPDGNFGLSNFRAQAAPMLMIAILAAIAAVKEDWKFITPRRALFPDADPHPHLQPDRGWV